MQGNETSSLEQTSGRECCRRRRVMRHIIHITHYARRTDEEVPPGGICTPRALCYVVHVTLCKRCDNNKQQPTTGDTKKFRGARL